VETVLTVSLGFLVVGLLGVVAIVMWAAVESRREALDFARHVVETAKASSLDDKINADHKRDVYDLNKQQMLDALSAEVEAVKRAKKEKAKAERNNFVVAENGKTYRPSQLEEVSPADFAE
jgi:hypothetical protein